MQFSKHFQILKAASSEKGDRRGMDHVLLEDGHLIATDTRVIAQIPVEACEDDTDGPIAAAAVKAALKGSKKVPAELCSESHTRPPVKFPANMAAIIPEAIARTHTLQINAKLLANLAAAIGAVKGAVELGITFDESGKCTTPIRVTASAGNQTDPSAVGAIMPITL